MRKVQGLAWGVMLATAYAAQAQQVVAPAQPVRETVPAPQATGPTGGWRVSQLLGSTVRLQGNNNFGKVEDLVVNPNGSPSYVVASANGRYVMLPWHAGHWNYGQRYVTYNVAPRMLEPLYFERNAWPNVDEPAYVARVRQVFPNAVPVNREVLRPAIPGGPVEKTPAPPPGTTEKINVRERPNGTEKVKIKER
jgi:hypothetical protein